MSESSTSSESSSSTGSKSTSSSSETSTNKTSKFKNNVNVKQIKGKVFWLFRPLHGFLRSEPDEYKTVKLFLGFPAGCLLGYALYSMVLQPMELGEDTRRLLGTMMVFGIGSGFSMAASVRCVCILLVPIFMGKAGRAYIGAFAIAFLISGPIENMVNNAQDITRSLTCAAELAANHTAAKWKLRMDPLTNVLKDMQQEGFLLNDVAKKINKSFRPIRVEVQGEDEVEGMEERTKKVDALQDTDIDRASAVNNDTKTKPSDPRSKKITQKYKRKIELRCEDAYNKGIQKCRDVFTHVYHKCKHKLPSVIDDIVCPIVNIGFVCDILKVVGTAAGFECNTNSVIESNFGDSYKTSDDTIDSFEKGFDVDLQYKVIKTKEEIDYTSVEEMKSSAIHEFKQGMKWVEFVMVIIKRMLGFTFLLVVYGAYKYYQSYTRDIRFDNVYITSYFRKIDARRKFQNKRVLLPLKKIEADNCINTSSLKLIKGERQKLGKGTFILLARAAMAGMIFFIDNILYTVLEIIRIHSYVDFKQKGVNHIDIKVGGTGVMSNIVRLFINSLSGRTVLDKVTSNKECLPRPSAMDRKYYSYVFGIYLLIWFLIFLDAYALRLRRPVAGFFYRKREKLRVLHLYNTMLAKRKYFLKDMRRKMKRKAKKLQLSKRSGLLYSLRRQFPGLCACLGLFTSAKNRCLVCDDVENKEFRPCDKPGCTFMYCRECWLDIRGTCYACLPLEDFSSTDSSDDALDTDSEL